MNSSKGWIAWLMAFGLAMAAGPVAADVYKTTDANGNVVYTDRPPTPETEPMELPGLSIVERPEYAADQPAEEAAPEEEAGTDLRSLRKAYSNFRLVSPVQEQSFVGSSNVATIAWEASQPLLEGMAVTIYLNNQALTSTRDNVVATPALDRGEYVVRAELKDDRGRVIANTEAVTFFVRQSSALTNPNRPVVTPHGGRG